jgi:hypothetical protein
MTGSARDRRQREQVRRRTTPAHGRAGPLAQRPPTLHGGGGQARQDGRRLPPRIGGARLVEIRSPVANATVEIWQCDGEGHYFEYAQQAYDGRGLTYLRGGQVTDSNGQVTFVTIYPGWCSGRATHIHVEVHVNGRSVKTTHIAFPEDVTGAVYSTGVYAAKGQNTTTNARDNVFSDGTSTEMATLTGNTAAGYTATLRIGIAV